MAGDGDFFWSLRDREEDEEEDVMPKSKWKEEAELDGLGLEDFMARGGDGGGGRSENWRAQVRDGWCGKFGNVGGPDECGVDVRSTLDDRLTDINGLLRFLIELFPFGFRPGPLSCS